MAFLRASATSFTLPSVSEAVLDSASASGSLHSGQRLAKPGLSGFSSNSSEQTTQTLIGKGMSVLFYDFPPERSSARARHFILIRKVSAGVRAQRLKPCSRYKLKVFDAGVVEFMAALIDAIDIKRKVFFEFENTPYYCLEADVSTPTARGGQTLVRLKMRNMLTRAVFDKTFKASDKFKEPDLQTVE